jgi:CBS domain containing-hemolysin-like protein
MSGAVINPLPGTLTLAVLGGEAIDIVLLAVLPLLIIASAFFSSSETALFGMSETERMNIRRSGSLPARAVETLLSDRRALLITVLLGNMTVNTLFFVISSVLMMRSGAGVAGELVAGLITLLTIVLFGEVLPKMIGSARRVTVAKLIAPPLLTFHRIIGPLRTVIAGAIVSPLSALTAPTEAPPQLDEEELRALIETSSRQGVIDADEQRILRDVLSMRRLKVRDVMIPRVRMHALPVDAAPIDVIALVKEARFTRLPVYEGDPDHILGVLPVKSYLLDGGKPGVTMRKLLIPARFVPVMITLDQLLDHFRRTHTQTAIVVDEYGGTSGIVSIEDVVETLVGDIIAADEFATDPPRQVGPNQWLVDGDISIHDWADAFGQRLVTTRVSTLGGLIVERLGRAAEVGDVIELSNVRLEVAQVDRSRVESAIVTLMDRRQATPDDRPDREGESETGP